jgi:AraC family transcriptional regulator of adaptative response / DNA-3-methyladenine glycosylase II
MAVDAEDLAAGRMYSAVRTTGIYCRPGCPASPLPQHVTPYASAAAAEAAGYRACLRCRPYRSSTSITATGPELVCRATHLIGDGLLDDGTEGDLARRLGVSARHLRRLFADHVGTTPDQLARSRRTHFARRLLDDTDLTVTDIAFASGFGSLRQLNRACQEVFRAAPTELRARRRRSDPLGDNAADGGVVLRLPFTGPLDWAAMLAYFERRAVAGVESVADGWYRRTVVVGGQPGVLELGRPADDHLVLRVHLSQLGGLIHVVQRARGIVGLDGDPTVAAESLAADPVLGPATRGRPGLRVPGTWDPLETGVRAIIGQQVSVTGASTVMARLVERVGNPVGGLEAMALTHTFPSAAELADANLDGIGLTGARIAAIQTLATAVDKGEVAVDGSASLEELVHDLCALRGIGPWTAHYLALRLGEPDAFPVGDLGLRRAARPGTLLSEAELGQLAETWRPHRAMAAVHLWTSEG